MDHLIEVRLMPIFMSKMKLATEIIKALMSNKIAKMNKIRKHKLNYNYRNSSIKILQLKKLNLFFKIEINLNRPQSHIPSNLKRI
jgi:hypothetical protein